MLAGGFIPESQASQPPDVTVAALDEERSRFESELIHDFATDGKSPDLFSGSTVFMHSIKEQDNGILTFVKAKGPWTAQGMNVQTKLSGDFDVEASFTSFTPKGTGSAAVLLIANFDDASKLQCRLMRMRNDAGKDSAQISLSLFQQGSRGYTTTSQIPVNGTSGRLRLARRGKHLWFLVADDQKGFQIVGSHECGLADTLTEGITLQSNANGTSSVNVVWQKLTIRANKLTGVRQVMEQLENEGREFSSHFRYEFTSSSLPERFFSVVPPPLTTDNPNRRFLKESSSDLRAAVTGAGRRTFADIVPRFQVQGDFDMELGMDELDLSGDAVAGVMLTSQFDDAPKNIGRAFRARGSNGRHTARVSLSAVSDGKRSYGKDTSKAVTGSGGRLRLSRRDDQIIATFKEPGSNQFRFIGQRTVSTADSVKDGLRIRVLADNGAETGVMLRDFELKAERLLLHSSNEEQRNIAVMNADGSNFRVLAGPPEYLTHVGSPEWSRDGKRIAFDASLGGTDTSRVMIMNADGSNVTDLGPGCMPSFSPSGEELVFSESGFGIISMWTDGSGRIRLDEKGWGTQWSPSGDKVAWVSGNNITVADLKTDQRWTVLKKPQAAKLRQIYWNFSWSNDGKSICFKARPRTGKEFLAVVDFTPDDAQAVKLGSEYREIFSAADINADLSWHPDDKSVLFSWTAPESKRRQVYTAVSDLIRTSPPKPLTQMDAGLQVFDCDWSPDGNQIVCSVIIPVAPLVWGMGEEQQQDK